MRKQTWKCLLGTLLLTVAMVMAHPFWAPRAATWLDVGEPFRKVEAVLALSGDPQRRPFVAAALWNVGLADWALVTRSEYTSEIKDGTIPPWHVVTERIYRARGVPEDRIILLEGSSSSTSDDVVLLARYLEEHPDQKVAVVTNGYHTRRTRWTLDERLPQFADRVHVFAAPNPTYLEMWWRTPDGVRTVGSEYLKLVAYFVRYAPGRAASVVGLVGLTAGLVIFAFRRRSA